MDNYQPIDEHIFDRYYKSYRDMLYRYALRIVGNEYLAEDIVHEAFTKLWNNRNSLQVKSPKPFLFKMIHNLCIDQIRKKSSCDMISFNNPAQKSHPSIKLMGDDSGFDRLFSEEIQNLLIKEIDKLPPKCKKIFLLNRRDAKSYVEIAELLEISHSTVKNQMAIAMNKLYKALKNFI